MRTITPGPLRLIVRRSFLTRIAARRDRAVGLLDCAHMRTNDAEHAAIERLFREPLTLLYAIGRNSDDRCHDRRERSRFEDLLAIEQILQRVLEGVWIPGIVLHLEDDRIDWRRADFDGNLSFRLGKAQQCRPPLLPSADHAVKTRDFCHTNSL